MQGLYYVKWIRHEDILMVKDPFGDSTDRRLAYLWELRVLHDLRNVGVPSELIALLLSRS